MALNAFHTAAPSGARVPRHPAGAVAARLLCLPYAGAGCEIYRHWRQWLAPRVEVLAPELPGRGLRVREPPVEHAAELAAALASEADPWLDRPLALFGHGMGALVAFELLRQLRTTGRPSPVHLFVSAQRAPHLPAAQEPLHPLPDGPFLAGVNARRGRAAAHPAGWRAAGSAGFVLPALRADFKLLEQYEHRPGPALDVPVTVFGGIEDRSVARHELEAWGELTRQACVVRWLPGNHFFVHEHQRLLAANLLHALQLPVAERSAARPLEAIGFVTG